jgi:hypothetical protein
MAIQVSGTTVISDGRLIQNLGGLVIPSGNTASRPATPSQGQMYHNTETDEFEVYATVTTPAGWVADYQGVVGGNNAVWATSATSVPSWAPYPRAYDTAYGVLFDTTQERFYSNDGAEHRITFIYALGYYSGNGQYYFSTNQSVTTKTIPATGYATGPSGIAFKWQGVLGYDYFQPSYATTAMTIESYSSGGTTTAWTKVGAY